MEDDERDYLISLIAQLLPVLKQEPRPLTILLQVLVRPERYSFTKALAIRPPVDFAAGLLAPSPSINLAVLYLLDKACNNLSDAGIVAGKPDLVRELVRCWLCTPVTEVAEKAYSVIKGLLEVDLPTSPRDGETIDTASVRRRSQGTEVGQYLMWRRLFKDVDIYGMIFSICSLTTVGEDGQPAKRTKSLAQARLLKFIADFGESDMIRTSQIPDVEQRYGVKDGGLLEFAAVQMVDITDDLLMQVTLIDFFVSFLGKSPLTATQLNLTTDPEVHFDLTNRNLQFLIKHGLHERTMSYFLEPEKHDYLDLAFLYSHAAMYVSAFVSQGAPILIQHAPMVVNTILDHLTTTFSGISLAQWNSGSTPKHDLHVLTSLPRLFLLPRRDHTTPLFHIPPVGVDAFSSLSKVFAGPEVTPIEVKPSTPPKVLMDIAANSGDRGAARALYYLYEDQYPKFWEKVTHAADIIALTDNALAANSLIRSILEANWGPLIPTAMMDYGDSLPFIGLTEAELAHKCQAPAAGLPVHGFQIALSWSAARYILPYLIKPAKWFEGGKRDSESAAYKTALAKYESLVALYKILKKAAPSEPVLATALPSMEKRIAEGAFGAPPEVGARVATREF